MASHVALLRGINVGGRNLIRMTDLQACFVEHGFADARTYIQSGNVVFTASGTGPALTSRIEAMLAEAFAYEASVVLRTRSQLRAIVERAPTGFGADPATFRSDVLFLKPPLTAKAALADVPTREGVDRTWSGTGVLYFERRIAKASQSRLSRIASLPIYPRLTIRNWNTTTKLLELMG